LFFFPTVIQNLLPMFAVYITFIYLFNFSLDKITEMKYCQNNIFFKTQKKTNARKYITGFPMALCVFTLL
jgi:hypothetical protein